MSESLATLQRRWADHVRDPSMPAPDGVAARRMAVYRRLCIDSLDRLLAGSRPRVESQPGDAFWRAPLGPDHARPARHTPRCPRTPAGCQCGAGGPAPRRRARPARGARVRAGAHAGGVRGTGGLAEAGEDAPAGRGEAPGEL